MRTMKQVWKWSLLLLLMMNVTACSNDDEKSNFGDDLIGTWELTYSRVGSNEYSRDTDAAKCVIRFTTKGNLEIESSSEGEWDLYFMPSNVYQYTTLKDMSLNISSKLNRQLLYRIDGADKDLLTVSEKTQYNEYKSVDYYTFRKVEAK